MFQVHLALFFVSLLYAILFSWAGQIMPNHLTSETFVWLRISFATVLFHVFSFFGRRDNVDWKKHWKEFAICGFFGTSANMYLFFKGLESTYPINGAVLMLFTPLFVGIFDHIRIKKWPNLVFSISIFVAAFSCFFLITSNGAKFSAKTMWGDIWVAINAMLYAVYLVRVKNLTQYYQPITINKWTFTFGFLFISPIALNSVLNTSFETIPSDIWIKIAYILFFTSFLVYLLNAFAVKKAGPTLAGLYIYLQPILATFIAFLLNTDEISWQKISLMLLVLVATFTATRYTPKTE